jgi:hypothetical protein
MTHDLWSNDKDRVMTGSSLESQIDGANDNFILGERIGFFAEWPEEKSNMRDLHAI